MSFIVFSTEGRILMSLTEDRWVQIPSERLLIPLFSVMQLKGMSLIPDLDTGHTHSYDPSEFVFFFCRNDIPGRYFTFLQSFYNVGLDKCFILLLLWSVYVSNLSSADFLCSHKILSPFHCCSSIFFFYKGLISSRSAWQFLKPLHSSCTLVYSSVPHCRSFFSCKCCACGNYYSVTTPPSIWLWSKEGSQMNLAK